MDRQLIKALIDALAGSDLSELDFTKDGATLRLVKTPSGVQVGAPAPTTPATAAQPAEGAALADSHVCAPLYGVVHLQPGPDMPPFVQVGQDVRAGQPLCVIEAMKVLTTIRAEADGRVAAVLVASGQDVEAGQQLFRFARRDAG